MDGRADARRVGGHAEPQGIFGAMRLDLRGGQAGREHGPCKKSPQTTHRTTLRTARHRVNRARHEFARHRGGIPAVLSTHDAVRVRLRRREAAGIAGRHLALAGPAAAGGGRPAHRKGSSYAVNARKLLPRHDARQTLAMLTALIDVLQPETVMCLGDSFHDRSASERLAESTGACSMGLPSGRVSSGSPATMIPRRRPRAGATSPRRSTTGR